MLLGTTSIWNCDVCFRYWYICGSIPKCFRYWYNSMVHGSYYYQELLLVSGIGISMVLASTLVGIYYNMVNAWAFHYLFSSMMAALPWLTCSNPWNQDSKFHQVQQMI